MKPDLLNLKDPAIQRRQIGTHLDSFIEFAAKGGFSVEVVCLNGGTYRMRRRGPKEITILVDGNNIVQEIHG